MFASIQFHSVFISCHNELDICNLVITMSVIVHSGYHTKTTELQLHYFISQ